MCACLFVHGIVLSAVENYLYNNNNYIVKCINVMVDEFSTFDRVFSKLCYILFQSVGKLIFLPWV